MTKKIEKIIVKFLMNTANVEELEMFTDWIKEPENKQLFKSYVKANYAIDINMKHFDTENAKKEYLNRIKKEKKAIYKLYRVSKYAAAAVIVFALGFFFRGNIFTSSSETDTGIVKTNIIQPGTDKATLTLEDGSHVVLEKGNVFQTENISSNGEQILYKDKIQNSKEVKYNYLTIPRGGEFFLKLSDGTQVWLNSESQLKYPVSFIKGITRQVELVYGEAYFDVSSSEENNGSKFKVFNNSQEVEVLGTEFNIKAYRDETHIYTTLVEGKVLVGNGVLSRHLVPNQQSNLNIETNTIAIAKVNVKGEISWKDGIFSFVDKPLKDIMKVVSRWYDVDIIFENKNLESVEFIGVIDKRQSIEEVLSIMKSSSINDYKINDRVIVLR